MKQPAIEKLVAQLDLERIDRNLFRGHSPQDGRSRVFGGLVAAQSLVAATRTVEGRTPHSLHGYFLRPGDVKKPLIYEVDEIRDGRSFTTRRVVAIQDGQAIFNMSVSFHREEEGLDYQESMPVVAGPEGRPEIATYWQRALDESGLPAFKLLLAHDRPFEHRHVVSIDFLKPQAVEGGQGFWFKACGELGEGLALHQCVLTYASDMGLVSACLIEHGMTWMSGDIMAASLDHAIWFHRPFRADQWLLYLTDSHTSQGARGLGLGRIFTQDGVLVATTAQECLMRIRRKDG